MDRYLASLHRYLALPHFLERSKHDHKRVKISAKSMDQCLATNHFPHINACPLLDQRWLFRFFFFLFLRSWLVQ